jgi:hypothetical protein
LKSNLARRAFWLIVRQRTKGLEVFTTGREGDVLPVFSFEEEAEMFFRLGLPEKEGWRVRESTCGELTSVLHASCRNIRHVAVDLLPETVGEGAVGFASLDREYFVQVLLGELTPPSVDMVGVAS